MPHLARDAPALIVSPPEQKPTSISSLHGWMDGFLHYSPNESPALQHHVRAQTAYSSPPVPPPFSFFLLLILICAPHRRQPFQPLMLLNNGEAACSSHAVTQWVRSRGLGGVRRIRMRACCMRSACCACTPEISRRAAASFPGGRRTLLPALRKHA